MYVVYTESKQGKVQRHYVVNTRAKAIERVKTLTLKYPDRQPGYKQLRKDV